jgi:hypothetical protein
VAVPLLSVIDVRVLVVAVFAVKRNEVPLIVVGFGIKNLQKNIALDPNPIAPVESNLVFVTGKMQSEPEPL